MTIKSKKSKSTKAAASKKPSGVDPSWVKKLIKLMDKYYPNVRCELNYSNPEELLVATILSAQCTDKRVNIVTADLFKKYKIPQDLATIDLPTLEAAIKSTGFYKNKAKNIKSCCQDLVVKYGGQVPQDLDEMQKLAGVGRKTANVVLGECFNIASGVVVDTHVRRLSNRFKLTKSQNPIIIERDLMGLIPKKHWVQFSHWLIHHGRQICKSQKPRCAECFLMLECPSSTEK